MADKLKVTITVVPTQGKTATKEVKVVKTGTKLSAVLKGAGISADNRDILLNGKPATPDTCVEEGDQIDAKDKTANVQVSERPQGS